MQIKSIVTILIYIFLQKQDTGIFCFLNIFNSSPGKQNKLNGPESTSYNFIVECGFEVSWIVILTTALHWPSSLSVSNVYKCSMGYEPDSITDKLKFFEIFRELEKLAVHGVYTTEDDMDNSGVSGGQYNPLGIITVCTPY